ncbi:MAG: hypothetical protein HYZ54_12160, partial [Ignavibacteriae bacterium]|nr:hypothetical protein [Ignavibacteriota bacterium]
MKNNDQLTDYFNAAKNSGAEFTQNELQRIVEYGSNECEGSFNFTSTNNWKRTLLMFTQALTFLTCITGIFVGIGTYHNSTSPSKPVQTTSNSEKKYSLNSETNIPSTKLRAVTSRNSNVRTTEQNKKEDVKRLNIDGITTISLTNEELAKLEIIVEKDCGITLFNKVLTGTFYNYNKVSLNNESKKIKSDEVVKESSHSIWKMTSTEHNVHKNNDFP